MDIEGNQNWSASVIDGLRAAIKLSTADSCKQTFEVNFQQNHDIELGR